MPCFYEAFVKGLRDAGNALLVFHGAWGRPFQGETARRLLDEARAWAPDLVIAFNNYGPDWAAALDCPVAVYEVDSPLYYQNCECLRARPERYSFFVLQERSREVLVDRFGVPSSRIFMTTHFTEVHAEPRRFERNIGFVGSRFYVDRDGNPWDVFMRNRPDAQQIREYVSLLAALRADPFQEADELAARYPALALDAGAVSRLVFALSMEKRVQTLAAVADLGLELRGTDEWTSVACECADLSLAYRPEKIVTVRDNQDFYNASRLCLNVNHLQAVSTFSWRVFDIMASNGCLVTEARDDVKRLFPKVPIPMFGNRFEAREQCRRLLENENLRQDVVAASQEAIGHFRFARILTLMESALGLQFHGLAAGRPVGYLSLPESAACETSSRPASYVIRRRLANLVPLRAVRRRLRRRIDLELEVFTLHFARAIAKKEKLERGKDAVKCLILGSSHALFGYQAEKDEFNLADVSLDLKSCRALLDYWLGRGMHQLERVVLFYDVFSPGNVLEKSSECFRRIPYVELYGLDCPPGRTDTSIGCDYAFARAAFRRYRNSGVGLETGDLFGNLEVDYASCALPDTQLERRVQSHIRLSSGAETAHLEAMRRTLASKGIELVVVMPPLRYDYLAELNRLGYDWHAALESLAGYLVRDLHDDPTFQAGDFNDMDHLNAIGARKLSHLIRVSGGISGK